MATVTRITPEPQLEPCAECGEGRLRAVIAFRRTQVWLDPEPSEFGHISLERPAHGGRPVAYPLQGAELADARQHREQLYRRHDCGTRSAA